MATSGKTYGADSIKVLEGLEAVRVRPGMYIGNTGTRGLNHLVYEIVDNAVDEHLAGFCNKITVTLEEDGCAIIEDDGRGIPVDMHEKGVSAARVVFSTLHAGGKFDNNTYQVSGGLHGVGSSVVNALSSKMEVFIHKNGKIHYDRYVQGKPDVELVNGLLPTKGKTSRTGTTIKFYPDPTIFEKTRFKTEHIKHRLHELTYLNPGLEIYFVNNLGNDKGEKEDIVFLEEDGLCKYIEVLNKDKTTTTDIIHISGKSDNIEVELVMQYTDTFEENVISFCNNIATIEGGNHVTGFKTKLTTLINSYARELGTLKEKDDNFSGADTRCGLTAILSIKHPDPQFEGQTKTKLGSSDATKATATVVGDKLTLYFDKNVETVKNCIAAAEKSAKIRKAEEKIKTNLLTKPTLSIEGNGKLANCEGRDASKNEIFIVEGDSAGGSAKTARNRRFQAILPIRGKILNVEKASIDKVLANEEIKTMIMAFGCGFSEGYGHDFDITKLKYDKIIFMTDADVDGAHIDTLLLTLFYRFMPELIRTGHVYLATPPLYKVMPTKGKEEYLYDDVALEAYRKKHKGSFTLQRYKGLGEMDADQLWETTMNPETRVLRQINIDDIMEANEITSRLMGTNVEARKMFIHDNAQFADIDNVG